jgi:hypothetical protein
MAMEGPELPAAALKAMGRGIPADRVLMPHVDLTAKQKQFVQAVAAGATNREAYLQAYDVSGSSSTISSTASRIAANPKVRAGIDQQTSVNRLRYSQNPLQIREFVVDSLQHEARTAQKPGDRLRALELLGKLADVAAFETRSVITHERSSDTTARLREKLARLGGVIDVDAHEHTREHPPAHAQAHEGDPTVGGEGQSGQGAGGGARSNNPHKLSEKNLPPHVSPDNPHVPTNHSSHPHEEDPHPLLKSTIPPMDGITSEEAPMEEEVGSHSGGRRKKERPIWEDPKRWYAETMGEVPKIEWQPREEAREEVQKRLRDDEGGG